MGLARSLLRALAGIAALWLLSVALVLLSARTPQIHRADAIVVLGAAQYNGHPSPVLQARLDYALELYRRGLAPRLILTGGTGRGDTVSEAEVGRRYVTAHGVPLRDVLVERHGVSSAQSIAGAAALMNAHGARRALLVSDPYHMLRLELLARRAGIVPLRAPAQSSPIARSRLSWRHYVLRESVIFPATALIGGR